MPSHKIPGGTRRTFWVVASFLLAVAITGCNPVAPAPQAELSPTPSPAVQAELATQRPTQTQPRSTTSTAEATPPAVISLPTTLARTPVSQMIGSAQAPIIMGVFNLVPPEYVTQYQQWLDQVGAASGLRFKVQADIHTEQEALEALGTGRIHIMELSGFAYLAGRQRGWIEPGAIAAFQQAAYKMMFVARVDSGLQPGNSPEALRQLAGRRPCYLERAENEPDLPTLLASESVLPRGLLKRNGVATGAPLFIRGDNPISRVLASVFRKECDFAAIDAVAPENFKTMVPDVLSGVTPEQWGREMQILYTTPPINPSTVLALSTLLPPDLRTKLAQAIVQTPRPTDFGIRLEAVDQAILAEFERTTAATGIDPLAYIYNYRPPNEAAAAEATATGTAPATDTVVIDVDPKDNDPFVPVENPRLLHSLVMPAIYAELVRMDAAGNYMPYLAASVPTRENGLVRFVGSGADERLEVTFQLRPNLTWQDGQPLTASDLVFSWNYVMQPGWPGGHYGNNGQAPELYVSSVEAVAPDRIVYRFMSQREARAAAQTGGKLGDAKWYADLAQQVGPVVPLDYADVGRNVYPQHLLQQVPVDQLATSDFAKQPVYAGAYRVVGDRQPDGPVILEAFEGFALGKPTIPRIVFGASYRFKEALPYWQTPSVLAQALAAGAVQAQLGFPGINAREGADPRAYDPLNNDQVAVQWAPRNQWETLDFNLANPHLADLKVRQAIAYAIDRQAIIDLALAGNGQLMRSYLPSWHPLYAGDAALPDYRYDPQKARALLKEAGYDLSKSPAVHPTRGPLELRFDSMDVTLYKRPPIAALIEKQLAAVGIKINVQFHDWQTFEGQDCTAIRNGRAYDLALAAWVGPPRRYEIPWLEQATAINSIPTPQNGCPLLKSNWPGWRNQQAEALLQQQLKNGRLALEQPAAYRQAWAEHQRLWATDLPSLPLFNVERPVTIARTLNGVQPSPFAFDAGVEDTWNIAKWTFQP